MKHDANRCGVSKKMFIAMLALVLALGCAVGGTIAWLTANTDPVVNTFTYGDINIELYEHAYDAATNTLTTQTTDKVDNYKIVPGKNLPKDPTVKVVANSEACWLFVKVEATGDFANGKVAYSVDTTAGNWTALTGVSGVYYREVENSTDAQVFPVLAGNKVTVSENLTKAEIANATAPTLTFTAYAVQRDGIDNVTDAWAKVNP